MRRFIRHNIVVNIIYALFFLLPEMELPLLAQGKIIDHNCTDITLIPESAINQAKSTLHIGYGHTSHGSQLTTGMTGLINFANNGGLGLSLAHDIFNWNNGGTDGALDLEEGDGYGTGWLDHDCGYYPDWVNETRTYLNDPSHADVNVIIWSWCGQASGYTEQQMIDRYLAPMSQLENDYPNVTFVYMTGHADGSGETGDLHLRNRQIRDYCIANNKVLYDFYDIECYDPDGNYYGDKYVSDDCSYTDGNWALEWQNSHVVNVDWYNCESAHSQPLNANRKAYAAWWLWAVLGGWDQALAIELSHFSATVYRENNIKVTWHTSAETNCAGFYVWRSEIKDDDYVRLNTSLIPGSGNSTSKHEYHFVDQMVVDNITYWYKIEEISRDGTSQFYGPVDAAINKSVADFKLFQNYPNPFNPRTIISYELPVSCDVDLSVYNVGGQKVTTLISSRQSAGFHQYKWKANGLPGGVYFYRLSAGDFMQMKKLILLQ
ncbi:MAG: T9SS type A sorting domain-containing protein [Syntrophaceae bacterium]|nr:T9SS type A sorting domain-containing protein [Syntrophaceae bacterium]